MYNNLLHTYTNLVFVVSDLKQSGGAVSLPSLISSLTKYFSGKLEYYSYQCTVTVVVAHAQVHYVFVTYETTLQGLQL